jgi:hypothetical protein
MSCLLSHLNLEQVAMLFVILDILEIQKKNKRGWNIIKNYDIFRVAPYRFLRFYTQMIFGGIDFTGQSFDFYLYTADRQRSVQNATDTKKLFDLI